MQINTPVRFRTEGLSSEVAARQAQAVGDGIGIVVGVETRDGVPFVNVHFAVYGAVFTGLHARDLVALDAG